VKHSFKSRFSVAFLLVIFFNTFVDLGHKVLLQDTLQNTLLRGGPGGEQHYTVLASILNAFILLPYIFLFTPSGFLSDKFSKPRVMFWTALAAVPIMILITVCYFCGYFWSAYFLTLLLGVQSAINSPAKYGHIKEIYSKSDIAKANAYTQTIVIVAILLSTCVFTVLFSYYVPAAGLHHALGKGEVLQRFAPLGFILIALASLETITTLFLAKRKAADPDATYVIKDYLKLNYLKRYWKHVSGNRIIFMCILGLTAYWAVSQVILVSYSAFLIKHMPGLSTVFVQGSIAIAGLGILLGALYAGRISRGYIETGIIPFSAIAITVCLFLLTHVFNRPGIIIVELMYGFFGGMFIVPLNSLIQYNASKKNLGKVLAGNNFCQNIGMFTFLLGNTIAALFKVDSAHILHAIFFLFLVMSVISIYMLPQYLLRYVVSFFMRRFYDLNVVGLQNIPEKGGVLLIGNHTSYLDWAIIQMACPRRIRFVMERSIVEKWYLRWLVSTLKMIPISNGRSKASLDHMRDSLNQGDIICIFPEGRLCRNGQLGKFHSGFRRAAKDSSAVVIPFYVRGLWGARVSRATSLYKKITRARKRDATLVFGDALPADVSIDTAKQAVTRLSTTAWHDFAERHNNIAREFYRRAKKGMMNVAVIDTLVPRLTYSTLLATVFYLKSQWRSGLLGQENVGILLPSSAAGVIANLTVFALAKTVVNINFTAGKDNMQYAVKASSIKTIITSRRFIAKLSAKGVDLEELLENHTVIYMEDCISKSGKAKIARNRILFRVMPGFIGKHVFSAKVQPEQTAAIVFSSGSEGRPKGVELTHSNIIANIKQTATVCNIERSDVALAALPLFHSFGLTTSMLMPLLLGCPLICYADPTDAKTIGKLVCRYRVTMMYGTSTFFNLYVRNRKCMPEMFTSLRVLIAGAEKLSPKVKSEFQLKFNKAIYEGYGATELSPVAGCSLPNEIDVADLYVEEFNRVGSVGLPLPGSAYRVVDPQTLLDLEPGVDGLVLVCGPQVMKGYLNDPEKTQAAVFIEDGVRWYKTGDKGHLDKDGFLTLVDRYSRFAKIGGEMVSLSAVEREVELVLTAEGVEFMAVAIADERKGEAIYVLHNSAKSAADIRRELLDNGVDALLLPSGFKHVDELPKLGSGKKDYVTAKSMVNDYLADMT
jgi:acyl-[acyl-carrier-protein]-phospholipid O-acyltransferase / long-chain-fatty-acid--[acyl-carrier-protein] ligase